MSLEPTSGKEPAILELAEAMQVRLNVLEDTLNSAVRRAECKDNCKDSARPTIPNIVDEILEVMQRNNNRIEGLTKLLQSDIINKLGK